MDFAITHSADGRRGTGPARQCPQCRNDALVLERRHVSPAHLGAPRVTEFYGCDACDARYQYSPADNRWRPSYQ
jgi:hypothetical protein